jgi:hypothetical protein
VSAPGAIVADPLATLTGADGTAPGRLSDHPVVERHGDEFTYTWSGHAVRIVLARLREHADGAHAEATITAEAEEIHWGRLNLTSTTAREQLIKKLSVATRLRIPWRPLLECVCRETTRAMRAGSPIVRLRPRPLPEASGFLVDPILPAGEIAVLFADGGSGKGFVALTLALIALHGLRISGLWCSVPRRVVPLYLDWEATEAEIEDRVYHLATGLGCSLDGLHYRRMDRALADEAAALRADVSRLGVGLVIVDSLAPASGPEPESADSVIQTMNALRSLGPGVTKLVIAHLSKSAIDQRTGAKPYGSVFTWNLARSVWELRKAEDDSEDLVVGLYHRKSNRGKLHPPIGLRYAFGVNTGHSGITAAGMDLASAPDLLARASTPQRLRAALGQGAATAGELAEALDLAEDLVSRTLRRMADRHQVVRLVSAPGDKRVRWGLHGG